MSRRSRAKAGPAARASTPLPTASGSPRDAPAVAWLPFVAALAVWLPSLRGEFLYDDLRMVVNNPVLQDPGNLDALLRFDPARPLLTLSWVASTLLGGLEPWAFHLPNILLHAGCAALVARLVHWLALARGEATPARQALFAGLFFACTPMAAETVAYVSSRSTGLCAFLGLLFLFLAAGEIQAARPRRRAGCWLVLLMALAAKEEAAAFPVLLVLLDLHGPARGRLAEVAGRWRLHLPFLLLPVVGFGARRLVVGSWLPEPVWPYGTWLATQALEFPGYLLRALLPLDPAFHRGTPPASWPPDLRTLLLAGLLLALLAWVLHRPHSRLAFAAAWMAAVLAPSSTLVPLKELVVDHRAYTGGLGAAWVAAGALATQGRTPLAAAVLIVMTGRAVLEQRTLANDESAWAAVVERNPGAPEAQLGLGLARLERGDHASAREHFRRFTELAPADPRGWSNLAAALAGERRFAEALAPMQRAVALSPPDSRMLSNLGALQAQAQRMDLAERTFEHAAALSPPAPQALLNLAAIRLSRGDATGAGPLLARAEGLRLPPAQRAQLARLKDELAALQRRPLSP